MNEAQESSRRAKAGLGTVQAIDKFKASHTELSEEELSSMIKRALTKEKFVETDPGKAAAQEVISRAVAEQLLPKVLADELKRKPDAQEATQVVQNGSEILKMPPETGTAAQKTEETKESESPLRQWIHKRKGGV